MFFEDASSKARLNEIIRWAAIGDTVGVLANRMSPSARAEKLTPEGILQLTIEDTAISKTSELLRATAAGLKCSRADGEPNEPGYPHPHSSGVSRVGHELTTCRKIRKPNSCSDDDDRSARVVHATRTR